MSGATNDKGRRMEEEVAAYFQAWGWPVRRVVQDGRHDRGDLEGLPDCAVQVKDHATQTLAAWADDVERQRKAAAEHYGVVISRRRGRPLGDSYVVLTLTTFAKLLATVDMERGFRSSADPA